MDLLITGAGDTSDYSKLYVNDRNGNFTIASNVQIDGVSNCSNAFADLNGNQKPDVCITGRNAGSASTTKIYINGAHTSIFESDRINAFELNVFPNPTASGFIRLNTSLSSHSKLSIRIFDFNGRLILKQEEIYTKGSQEFKVDISSLNSGSYLNELDVEVGTATKEFIVN